MFPDFKELLSIFNAHGVKYLIVGGYAVSFHAQPRATKDVDLLIKPDADNAKAVYTALAKFGAPVEGLTPEDLREPGKFFRMGREPVAVDILLEIDGVDFDRAWERRVEGCWRSASLLLPSRRRVPPTANQEHCAGARERSFATGTASGSLASACTGRWSRRRRRRAGREVVRARPAAAGRPGGGRSSHRC